MIIEIDKYIAEIGENSILVLPRNSRCRVKHSQMATYAELYSLKPNYVRETIARRLRYIGYVYLYHFDEPYPAGTRPQHYLGFSKNVSQRELQHLAGNGARLMQVVAEAGIGWQLGEVWVGDRYFERKLKREGHYHRHCTLCKAREGVKN